MGGGVTHAAEETTTSKFQTDLATEGASRAQQVPGEISHPETLPATQGRDGM